MSDEKAGMKTGLNPGGNAKENEIVNSKGLPHDSNRPRNRSNPSRKAGLSAAELEYAMARPS